MTMEKTRERRAEDGYTRLENEYRLVFLMVKGKIREKKVQG